MVIALNRRMFSVMATSVGKRSMLVVGAAQNGGTRVEAVVPMPSA